MVDILQDVEMTSAFRGVCFSANDNPETNDFISQHNFNNPIKKLVFTLSHVSRKITSTFWLLKQIR